MKPYLIAIPAGQEYTEQFGKGATYVRLNEGTTVKVTLKSYDNDEEYTLSAGDDVIFSPFSELAISHDGAGIEAFTLYIGRNGAKASASRIGGSVQVTGGSNNDASPPLMRAQNETLIGGVYLCAAADAASGTNPAVLLWNPAGSGVNLIVNRFAYVTSSAQAVDLYRVVAPQGVLTAGSIYNKMSMVADGLNKASVYVNNGAALPASIGFFAKTSAAEPVPVPEMGSSFDYQVCFGRDDRMPYIITPGTGLMIANVSSDISAGGFCEWQEVPA